MQCAARGDCHNSFNSIHLIRVKMVPQKVLPRISKDLEIYPIKNQELHTVIPGQNKSQNPSHQPPLSSGLS